MKTILRRSLGIAAVIGLVALLIGFWTNLNVAPFFWAALTAIIIIQPIIEWLNYKETGRKIHLITPILCIPLIIFIIRVFFAH